MEESQELDAYIQMDQVAKYKVGEKVYKLPQDYILISNGLDASPMISGTEDRISRENKVLEKLRMDSLNTGRSPYTSSFRIRIAKQKPSMILLEEISNAVPKASWALLKDLIEKKWLKTVESDSYEITIPYSVIKNSDDLNTYPPEQEEAIKKLLIDRLTLFDIEDKSSFSLDVIGFGYYLDNNLWKMDENNQKILRVDYGLEEENNH